MAHSLWALRAPHDEVRVQQKGNAEWKISPLSEYSELKYKPLAGSPKFRSWNGSPPEIASNRILAGIFLRIGYYPITTDELAGQATITHVMKAFYAEEIKNGHVVSIHSVILFKSNQTNSIWPILINLNLGSTYGNRTHQAIPSGILTQDSRKIPKSFANEMISFSLKPSVRRS